MPATAQATAGDQIPQPVRNQPLRQIPYDALGHVWYGGKIWNGYD